MIIAGAFAFVVIMTAAAVAPILVTHMGDSSLDIFEPATKEPR